MKRDNTSKASKLKKPINRLQVKDLKPNRPIHRLDLIILRVYPRRLIYSDSYTGPVAAACGRDETGLVGVLLWDKQIDEVKIGVSLGSNQVGVK
ncbi:MAG: hypothetical protein VXV95_03870 [Candidatus Thermoplasmatota archaeon]|nr:hypothetical protein [Candidatus Thermoplasmatota archaeon]